MGVDTHSHNSALAVVNLLPRKTVGHCGNRVPSFLFVATCTMLAAMAKRGKGPQYKADRVERLYGDFVAEPRKLFQHPDTHNPLASETTSPMKPKIIKLTPKEKQTILKFYSDPSVREPLVSEQLTKTLADFRKRFAKMSKECNSIGREFSCFTLQDVLWHAAQFIDDRFEILDTTMFKLSVDNEYLIWDELMRGKYIENVLLVLKAKTTFLQIMLLMSEKELKIPVLLSLYYKLGLCMQAFFAMSLVQPAAAKLALLDKAKEGGFKTAKLRPKDKIKISTWYRDLDKPDKKRKKLYAEVTDKWNTTYPDREVCVRTMETFLKKNL